MRSRAKVIKLIRAIVCRHSGKEKEEWSENRNIDGPES